MAETFSIAKAIIKPANSSQSTELGILQDISIDFNRELKELKGQNAYAILAAQGGGSCTGKASFARFNAEILGALLGATKTSGATLLGSVGAAGQAAQLIPTTPFTVTVTPPNSGTWSEDGGVTLIGVSELYNTPMTKVTGTPTTGQYSVTAGAYVFAAADVGKQVIIDYHYTTESGNTLTLPNPVQGTSYPFSLIMSSKLESKECVIKFPQVVSGKLAMPFKLNEFTMLDFDFTVFADGAGNIGYLYTI